MTLLYLVQIVSIGTLIGWTTSLLNSQTVSVVDLGVIVVCLFGSYLPLIVLVSS